MNTKVQFLIKSYPQVLNMVLVVSLVLMMLSDVCLSDVCCVHPVGGRRVRPAGWMARIG